MRTQETENISLCGTKCVELKEDVAAKDTEQVSSGSHGVAGPTAIWAVKKDELPQIKKSTPIA